MQVAERSQTFRPFEATVACPDCGHTIDLWVQPMHRENRTLCPVCSRALTGIILRLIEKETISQRALRD